MSSNESPQLLVVFNLVQDVAILRPLVYLAHDDLGIQPTLVCCSRLKPRDLHGIWLQEIEHMRVDTKAQLLWVEKPWQLWQAVAPGRGVMVCASESELNNHLDTRLLVQSAPSNIITLTLQHGWECVGFLMNKHQQASHGVSVGMYADVIASWRPVEELRDLRPLLRSRVVHTGPTTLITHTSRRRLQASGMGQEKRKKIPLICENLHSVRFQGEQQSRSGFLHIFEKFAAARAERGEMTALRPHPAGQYTLKTKQALPNGVRIVNEPTYRIPWEEFSFGISAPSTVLLDMMAHGLPTAVWVDADGDLDTRHLACLPKVSSLEEWLNFEVQHGNQAVPVADLLGRLDAHMCTERHRDLLASLLGLHTPSIQLRAGDGELAQPDPLARPLIVCDDERLPTLEICLLKPWRQVAPWRQVRVFSPPQAIKRLMRTGVQPDECKAIVLGELEKALAQEPSVVIFCRYVGPLHQEIMAMINRYRVASYYFIDDLLTAVPEHIGLLKHQRYISKKIQASLRGLMRDCDGVISANFCLATELEKQLGLTDRIKALEISCPGVVNPMCDQNERPHHDECLVIGYMGFDHDADFEIIAPVIGEVLAEFENVRLEIIGPLKVPTSMEGMGKKITCLPAIRNYPLFLELLASRRWHIGLAPLLTTQFNQCKSINKWVEYTSCGAITVASAGVIYDHVCGEGGGLLAATTSEWRSQLFHALESQPCRQQVIRAARMKLNLDYSPQACDSRWVNAMKLRG